MPVTRSNTLFFNKRKSTGFDYNFIDDQIRQKLYVGGTDLNVYKVLGTHDQYKDVTDKSNVSQNFSATASSLAHRGADKAFDNNDETYYESSTIPALGSGEFIRIDFGTEDKDRIIINGFGLSSFDIGNLPQDIEFQGSMDGVSWDSLGNFVTTALDELQRFDVTNTTAYRYYQILAQDETWNSDVIKIKEIELYSEAGATGVQDKFFLENRDRKYSASAISLLTWYEIPEKPHDLGFFGFGIPTDQVELTLLISDTKTALGRSLQTGDIVTLPHIGDDSNDEGGPVTGGDGKMYEVVDPTIDVDGYDVRWRDHLYKVVCVPLKHRQETYDVTGDPNEGYIDLSGTHPLLTQDADIAINNEIQREAENAGHHGQDRSGIYDTDSRDIRAMDGIPNTGEPYTVGTDFPVSPNTGDWFLHEGYSPAVLYQWDGYRWIRQEIDAREGLDGRDSQRGNLKDILESGADKPLDK